MGSGKLLDALDDRDVSISKQGSLVGIGNKDLDGNKDVPLPDESASLQPVTPDISRDSRDSKANLESSPFVLGKDLACFKSYRERNGGLFGCNVNGDDDNNSPVTPKEDIFDPFAPGPDDVLLAPRCKKLYAEWKSSVSRRLNFGSLARSLNLEKLCDDVSDISDEEIVESVYENVLETILSKKAVDLIAEMSIVGDGCDGCRTPPLAPRLDGISETCPPAPMKAAGRTKKIDLGLCRKLEF